MTADRETKSYVNGCLGKNAYGDKKEAQKTKKSLQRSGEKKRGKVLTAYRCRHCGFWHVGWRAKTADDA